MSFTIKVKENVPLVNHFNDISEAYLRINDKRRFSTFRKVAGILANVDEVITLDTDITEHAGIGDSSWDIQQEFLKTGTSTRYEELKLEVLKTEKELDNRPIENKVADKLAEMSHLSIGEILSALLLWKVVNGLSDVQSMIDNVDEAPPFLRTAGLLDALRSFQ